MSETGRYRDDEILQGAVELPIAEREAYLAETGEDDAQRERIRALIDAHGRAGRFLDRFPTIEAEDAWIDTRVGPYELTSLLGEGGSGRVYEARRVSGDFDQRVAIKILRRSIDAQDDIRRFRTESEALGRLEHPNVARLLDGGMLDDFHPYLVMERVEGRTLYAHCDEERLNIEARLRLFLQVCDAVEYAHRNLVIHRDIKPSNIMVTAEGRVKLLDFGIAKLLSEENATGDVAPTVTTRARLTPRYASPEQLSGQAINTLSDVYSLGVILYELLSGTPPYRLEGTASNEWIKVIEDTTIARPSGAVADGVPLTHGEMPAALGRRLRGDLDNVVLLALRREPARRYGSPRELGDDVRRYLDSLPVSARPLTWSYRLSKAARRNPVGVAAGALAVVALVGAATISSISLLNVRQAQHESDRERRTAERTVEFLQSMIASVDPDASQSREQVTVLELLEGSERKIDEELADEPIVAARLHSTLGDAYEGLQVWDRARHSMRRALELNLSEHGGRHRDSIVAGTRYASFLAGQSALDSALVEVDLVLERSEGAPDADRLVALSLLCDLLARHGDFAAAIEVGERALAIAREVDSAEVRLYVFNNVGLAYVRSGRPGPSIETFEEAVAVAHEVHGEEHSETGRMYSNLGYANNRAGRTEDAITALRRTLEIYEKVYEPDHTRIGVARSNLADALNSTGEYAAAAVHHRAAINIFRNGLGPDHVNVGHATHNLGAVFMMKGDYADAITHFDEALVIYRGFFGDIHPVVAAALHNKARCLRRAGDLDAAQAMGMRVLDIRNEVLEDDHPDIARSSEFMGRLMTDLKQVDEALPWFERSARIRRAIYAEDNLMRIDAERELGLCLMALERFEEAEVYLSSACGALAKHHGDDDERNESCRSQLDELNLAWGRTPPEQNDAAEP